MPQTYVMTGTLADDKTVQLDQALPVSGGKVRVTVEVLEAPSGVGADDKPQWLRVLEGIWEDQRRRGHVPRSADEIEAQIREERESWGD